MEFQPYPKTPRLFRDIVITEKIDGTNWCIYIWEDWEFMAWSRTRWITPENDNFWFAQWAYDNKEDLMKLWVWFHYGEWYGRGIQRSYNLKERHFALFYVKNEKPDCCTVVPRIYEWVFNEEKIHEVIETLRTNWSNINEFPNAEWIIIYHTQSKQVYKVLLEKDNISKTELWNQNYKK